MGIRGLGGRGRTCGHEGIGMWGRKEAGMWEHEHVETRELGEMGIWA